MYWGLLEQIKRAAPQYTIKKGKPAIQDWAMSPTGGIDLTPANMYLQTQNNGSEIKFHVDPAMLQQLQNALSFTPVIINIEPIKDLPTFLGIHENSSPI